MKADNFLLQKQNQLSMKDNSNIGKWDKKIENLCNKINKKKNYYTTSSCAGRLILLKYSDKKIENAFLFRSHNKISFNELKKTLAEINYKELVEFQQTSCILHVACKTIEDAFELVRLAKLAGWKRSGVMSCGKGVKSGSRFMVEIHSTESMSFPIMNNRKILADDVFLKSIVEIANKKLERIWKKIERLKKLF